MSSTLKESGMIETERSASVTLPLVDERDNDSNNRSASTTRFDDDISIDLEAAEVPQSIPYSPFSGMGGHDSMDLSTFMEEEGKKTSRRLRSHKISIAAIELETVTLIRRITVLVILGSLGTATIMGYLFVTNILDENEENDETTSKIWNEVLYPAIGVAMIFPVIFFFFLYDFVVRRAIRKLDKAANKSAAIVNNLFPENVRERVLKQESSRTKAQKKQIQQLKRAAAASPSNTLATSTSMFTTSTSTPNYAKSATELIPKEILTTKPIADFFPHCTVLFADIVGFTAWSSVRDPTDVFTLLESLYSSFDTIARHRKVFKVETIGDCYVAVTGLPEPMEDHAVVMAKFARQCMWKMMEIVHALEIHLGPDTGDLSMRFGLHSGPVTAGVMRGEKSRFQLFGDTVNTAARVESTGERGKIHLSEETADLIIGGGKQHWITARENKVKAKGKGTIQTYWLEVDPLSFSNNQSTAILYNELKDKEEMKGKRGPNTGVSGLVALFEKAEKLNTLGERTRRQSEYSVEVLARIAKRLIGIRGGVLPNRNPSQARILAEEESKLQSVANSTEVGTIEFPDTTKISTTDSNNVVLPSQIQNQLQDLVATIASMYQNHSFHNFERASHVTLSLTKLISRLENQSTKTGGAEIDRWTLQKDPLAEFALIFAALIHGIDHPGVSNTKLGERNSQLVKKYGRKSCSELNSLDLGWKILMRPAYEQLRWVIYSTVDDLKRFRKLVVSFLIATDVQSGDKLRQQLWDRCFAENRLKMKKTGIAKRHECVSLILETMVQSADIAHCTQHWNVYIKWNRRLFRETYEDFKKSRDKKDPAELWYQEELSFFDNVVIPLAKKLKDSNAFGDVAEEYLNYARSNRRDWHAKGRDVLLDYMSEYRGTHKTSSSTSPTTDSTTWASDSSQSLSMKYRTSSKWTLSNSFSNA